METLDSSAGGFKVDATTGVISVADPSKLDYETAPGHAYTVTVVATDGTNPGTGQTFTIGVTDVAPSTPVDSDGAANTVVEGAANGSTVGVTASSTNVNGPAVTWSLTGDTSGGGFFIDPTTGVVHVADSTKIDFESSGPSHTYTVTAQASDGQAASARRPLPSASPMRRPRPRSTATQRRHVVEGAAAGSTVGVTVFDRHQRPAGHLFADRRHLRRRFHHQYHDRRHHRRRYHQDRLREFARAIATP